MTNGVDQHGSTVSGDQVAGDKYSIEIEKELSPAVAPIRTTGSRAPEDTDVDNTILLRKLRAGAFNKNSINLAIRSKAEFLKLQIEYSQTQKGRATLKDIQENLLTIINTKYISQMNEGDTLRTSLKDISIEFTAITNKYRDIIHIDEAFIEGMLYAATSECAVNWKIEGFDDEN